MTETTISDAKQQLTLDAVRSYTDSDNPSAFLGVNTGNSHFVLAGQPGVVVYRPAGRYLVQFGGPFAPPSHYLSLLRAFLEFAQQQQRTVVAVQLQRRDAEQYAREGFTVNQIGSSYVVDLDTFTLQGTRFMRLRNKISRALRTGLEVVEADAEAWHDRMRDLDREWLGAKGEHAQELEFLVGQYGGAMQKHRRLFAATVEGRLVAYITYSPVYGSRPGWLHDLSRRLPGGTPGVMEAINRTAIEAFRREGVRWLHFGFTPFTGLDDSLELAGRSVAFSRFMSLLWQHGEAVYPARTQLAYKEKWAPSTVLTEYVAFHGPASVAAFAHIFRACNAF